MVDYVFNLDWPTIIIVSVFYCAHDVNVYWLEMLKFGTGLRFGCGSIGAICGSSSTYACNTPAIGRGHPSRITWRSRACWRLHEGCEGCTRMASSTETWRHPTCSSRRTPSHPKTSLRASSRPVAISLLVASRILNARLGSWGRGFGGHPRYCLRSRTMMCTRSLTCSRRKQTYIATRWRVMRFWRVEFRSKALVPQITKSCSVATGPNYPRAPNLGLRHCWVGVGILTPPKGQCFKK